MAQVHPPESSPRAPPPDVEAHPASPLEPAVRNALEFAKAQLEHTAQELTPPDQYPKSTRPDGSWTTVAASGSEQALVGWTQGFLPGCLWYLSEKFDTPTRSTWRVLALHWTLPLQVQRANMRTHDLGFKFWPSFGFGYRDTIDPGLREIAVTAAGALASRYNPRTGHISTCDWGDVDQGWHLPLVIDTMMDIELLFWAATQNQITAVVQGQEGWRDMALNHALRTLADLVRPDGTTYQLADYDPLTGNLLRKGTFQGYSDTSTWARGQAWAVYGFTLAYRYTGDARMLDAARRTADAWLGRLPPDGVPNWDFDAPAGNKDSSAAAITTSALYELSTFMADPTLKARYRDAADRTLAALCSPAYLARGSRGHGILLHGVGNFPAGQEIDVSLIYGDFYFIESMLRYPGGGRDTSWYSRLDFASGTQLLGTGNTGRRVVEFDVTPLGTLIDAVLGWTDTSTPITAYSSLPMALRMNDQGSFDVRNGGGYAADHVVPYGTRQTFHVRLVADLGAKTYSVWVKARDGEEVQIANQYAFRSGAPAIDDIGKVCLKAGRVANDFIVTHHTVRPARGS